MKKLSLSLLPTLLLSITAMAEENGFKPLFNGKDLNGWKPRNESAHNAWAVQDGILKNDIKAGAHGTDLVTEQKFWNFTVRYEYMVPEGSNSGFYLRGRHELQILGQKDQEPKKGGDGAIYNFKAPEVFASKPAGEWNTAEATIIGNKISLTLNGKKVHDSVECKVATGSEIDNKIDEPGPIFLQGDHGVVSFRKIEIKELPKE
jgi:hypothetical protein